MADAQNPHAGVPESPKAASRDSQSPVLSGLKCVRLGASRAGVYLARILADEGAEIIQSPTLEQAREADIVIDDLGRGVDPSSGFDFPSLSAANPSLVYCALVSFPENGPKTAKELEDEPVLSALGFNRYASDAPARERLPIASFFGGTFAALYIACALRPKIREAGPQYIEVSLFAAALNVLGRATLQIDDPRFADVPAGTPRVPIADLYRCGDGRYLQPHATFPHFARIICEAGGHSEWGQEAGEGLRKVKDKDAEGLWRRRFSNMWSQKTALDWENDIERRAGSATIVRTRDEWRDNEHARTSRIFVHDAPNDSWRVGPGTVVKAHPLRDVSGAPNLSTRSSDCDGRLPLAGLRVADFCIIIAGPTVGRLLSDLGADVVKVDAPNRELSPYLWFDVNRGKRSLCLDLRTPEGKKAAHALIAEADIVSENFRSGKFKALGFGYDSIVQDRPEIIYVSTNAFDFEGPWEQRPGWEHNAQAATGQQVARAQDGVPKQVPYPLNDYATGLLGALGVVFAVLRRDLCGCGSRITGSLSRSGTFLQLLNYEPDLDPPPQLGEARVFDCLDGFVSAWPRVGCPSEELALERLAADATNSTCDALLERIGRLSISCMRELKPKEMLHQKWVADSGLSVTWTHPVFGRMTQTTPRAVADRFQARQGAPAPAPGMQTREILRTLGFDGREDELIAMGVAFDDIQMFDRTT